VLGVAPEVLSADLSRVLRVPPDRGRRRPRGTGSIPLRRGRGSVRADLLFRAADLPDLALHVEICEDMWVPVPPSAEAALAGATVLANLSGSPITVAKARDRAMLCESASSRCLAAYLYAAAGEGESTTDLSWDGQTMVWENGALLAESERFPAGARRRWPTSTSSGCARNGCGRAPSTTTGAPTRRSGLTLPRGGLPARPAARRSRAAAGGRPLPLRARRPRPAGPGLLRGVFDPGVGPGAAAAGDRPARRSSSASPAGSTRPMRSSSPAGRWTGLGRPRTDVLAFTMPGFATSDHTKANAIALMESLGVTWAELDIRPAATQMLRDLGHPFGQGEPVYDVTFENVQAGLRTDYLFRIANQRGGIVLGHRRPVRAGPGLVHLRRRRPDVALRRQHRGAQDPHAAPHPLGHRVGAVLG
jgi:NAD+ synthase (glutamine-hydrolysing)